MKNIDKVNEMMNSVEEIWLKKKVHLCFCTPIPTNKGGDRNVCLRLEE